MPVSHSQTLLCEWPRNSGLNNDALTPFCFLLWGIWVQRLEEQQPTSLTKISCCCCSLMSDCLQFHGRQHTRLLFAPLSPALCSNSYPLNQWCCLIISSSATPFSFNFQPFPASGSFPMSRLFTSSDQSIAASASASVLPMNIQDLFPWGLTGLISLLSKGLSRVFFRTTIWKHQFFGAQPSLWSNSHIYTWLLKNHRFACTDLCRQSDVSAF